MSEFQIDESLIGSVKPIELPETVSEIWKAAYLEPVLRWLPIAEATYQEWPERPNCGHFYGGAYYYGIETAYPIMTYAVAYLAGRSVGYDGTVPLDDVLQHAIGAIRYLGFTHNSGPDECVRAGTHEVLSGTKWGGEGANFFQASQTGSAVGHMCQGAWLLWDELDDETRQLVANVASWYAERWCEELPRVGTYGNTQTEENGWTAHGLDTAACLLQGHPDAGKWREAADKWIANIFVTPYDYGRNAAELQGTSVKEWSRSVGATIHPDFSVENHGFVHPSYLASGIGFAGEALLNRCLGDMEVSEVVRFNRQPIYETMKKLAEDDGPMLAVQGMDWWYFMHATLLPISTVSPHAVMNLLFEDPHAAYIERRATQRVKQVMDSIGDGHVSTPDPIQYRINEAQSFRTYERSAMVSAAGSFLLHWLMGDGAEPCTEAEFKDWQQGVHVFPHGGFVTRKGQNTTASFSWRNWPVVVVQPKGGTWVVTPHFHSLSGTYKCEPAWEGGMRNRQSNVAEDGNGFAAVAQIEREGGKLIQNMALIVPEDGIAFFFDRTTAAEAVKVVEQRSGEVGVRNEDYSEMADLAPGKRTLYTEQAEFTSRSEMSRQDEWFRTDETRWANVDNTIGYVIFGSKGIAYQAKHHYPTYTGMEDFLVLSYTDRAAEYGAGDVVSDVALAIYPNQTAEATRSQVGRVLRAEGDGPVEARLTPEYLAVVNLAQEPLSSCLRFAVPDWDMVPVPEGCTVTHDEGLEYEVSLGKFCADCRKARVQVENSGQWEATAAATGAVYLKTTRSEALTLQVVVDGRTRTVELEPGRVIEI